MITIHKSPTADTRTCNASHVTKEELLQSTEMHIADVRSGLFLFIRDLSRRCTRHDYTKISHLDEFYRDFQNNFNTTEWWEMHKREERHHLDTPDGERDDVNMLDVLEWIVDGVMAGKARSGEYYFRPISDELLQKALTNTIKLLLDNVQVVDE